jgi:lysophospholipase L1-like esterase
MNKDKDSELADIAAQVADRRTVNWDEPVATDAKTRRVLANLEAIVEALERFDADVHRELPDTRILVLAIKPSVLRWKLSDKMRDANRLIEQFVQQHADHMSYVDLGPLLLDEKGEPRPELYKADGLHMNEDGYKLWSEKLRPILMDAAQQQQH